MGIENWEPVFKCPYYDECHNTDLYFDNEQVSIVNENIECKAPLLKDINGEVICLMTCSNVDDYKLFVTSKNKQSLLKRIKNIFKHKKEDI